MDDFLNPSKKPRLDQVDEDQDSDDGENIWGQINFTAEELDLLEEKATQEAARQENKLPAQQAIQVAAQNKVHNNTAIGQPSCFTVITNGEKDNAVVDRLKLDQYALEGKNKALSELLSKTLKELNDERLNREQIIELKLSKFKKTEIDLHQEIEKLNTTLLFKDQELRTERSKYHTLENKLKQKADELQLHANSQSQTEVKRSAAKKSPGKLPDWCSFDYRNKADTAESEIQTEILRERKFPLPVQKPRGEFQETDAVCRLLSCRVVDWCCESDPVQDSEGNKDPMGEIFKQARDHCSMSVTAMRYHVESDNVWRPYELVLQKYVTCLKTERSSLRLAAEKVCIFSEGMSHSNLNQQKGVLSCLSSLTRLLFHRCPKGNFKYSTRLNCNKFEKSGSSEDSASSLPLFTGDEEKMDITQNHSYSLLELLIILVNPTTYPGYYQKTNVMEWALSALVAWASHSKESLESCTQDLPFHFLVSGKQGMECAYLTLKLMSSLIGLTSFKGALVHHSDSWCILCSIGNLCECIHNHYTGNPAGLFVNATVNFLFGILNCYGFTMIREELYPCSSQLLQGIVIMLSRQLGCSQDCTSTYHVLVMRNGVMLLYFMVAQLPNFKARLVSVEEKYISLICELARLCEKNTEFKKFQDKVMALCNLQSLFPGAATKESEERQNIQDLHVQPSAVF